MRNLIMFGKVVVGLFWVAVIVNLLFPLPAPYAMAMSLAGLVALVAHIVESAVFMRQNGSAPTLGRDLLQILLFGAVHMMSVKVSRRQA